MSTNKYICYAGTYKVIATLAQFSQQGFKIPPLTVTEAHLNLLSHIQIQRFMNSFSLLVLWRTFWHIWSTIQIPNVPEKNSGTDTAPNDDSFFLRKFLKFFWHLLFMCINMLRTVPLFHFMYITASSPKMPWTLFLLLNWQKKVTAICHFLGIGIIYVPCLRSTLTPVGRQVTLLPAKNLLKRRLTVSNSEITRLLVGRKRTSYRTKKKKVKQTSLNLTVDLQLLVIFVLIPNVKTFWIPLLAYIESICCSWRLE